MSNGIWLDGRSTNREWVWSDDSPIGWAPWISQPQAGTNDCLGFSDLGDWTVENCDQEKDYICEATKGI